MEYLVIMEPGEQSWSAYSPDLLGCDVAGDTRDETLELMRGAIRMHLEGMRQDGQAIPEPSTVAEYVAV